MYEKEVVRCKNCAYWVQDESSAERWGECEGLTMAGIKIEIFPAANKIFPITIDTHERFFCSAAVRRRT